MILDLQHLRSLAMAATPGPWISVDDGKNDPAWVDAGKDSVAQVFTGHKRRDTSNALPLSTQMDHASPGGVSED